MPRSPRSTRAPTRSSGSWWQDSSSPASSPSSDPGPFRPARSGHRTGMTERDRIQELLREHGTTYAEEAGITLRDKPAPLFQLLVLTLLASHRISAGIAGDAARELFAAGWRTPERMRRSTWQQRVDALGRAHFRRYDESTATRLDE